MRFVGATIATTGALLIVSPASAYAVSGYFCSGAYLTPGNACGHSPQHEFADVYGYNSGNAVPEICAGVSNTAAGNPPKSSWLNYSCSSYGATGVACTSNCLYNIGYAFVEDHGTIADNFTGYLDAYW